MVDVWSPNTENITRITQTCMPDTLRCPSGWLGTKEENCVGMHVHDALRLRSACFSIPQLVSFHSW